MGFSRQKYWTGLPLPPPGDLPNPRIEPTSLMSPALAGGFFSTSTTRWEWICLFWLSCLSETITTLLRNGGFPAMSINKDVAGISDSSPPKVNFWAQRATRKNNACYLAALELQPLPTVSTKELRGCEHTGYWPQIAEMHMKGMISVSPDSSHLPIHRKALNSLTWDIWFSLTIIFWCAD